MFPISNPTLDHTEITPTGSARVTVTVTNTDQRDGDDVLQLYFHHDTSSVVPPTFLLKAFQRVHVPAGRSGQVTLPVTPDKLAILDRHMKWTVEPGPATLMVGDSSAKTVPIPLTVKPYPVNPWAHISLLRCRYRRSRPPHFAKPCGLCVKSVACSYRLLNPLPPSGSRILACLPAANSSPKPPWP